eukprot:5980558-Amphidinium_carterae.1
MTITHQTITWSWTTPRWKRMTTTTTSSLVDSTTTNATTTTTIPTTVQGQMRVTLGMILTTTTTIAKKKTLNSDACGSRDDSEGLTESLRIPCTTGAKSKKANRKKELDAFMEHGVFARTDTRKRQKGKQHCLLHLGVEMEIVWIIQAVPCSLVPARVQGPTEV